MPVFEYNAVDVDEFKKVAASNYQNPDDYVNALAASNSAKSGYISVDTPQEAADQLNEMGLVPVRLIMISEDNTSWRLTHLKNHRDKLFGVNENHYKPSMPPAHKLPIGRRELRLILAGGITSLIIWALIVWAGGGF